MVTIASNTQGEIEIVDALKANGLEPVAPPAPAAEVKPAVEEQESAPAGEPGEKIPVETEGKSAATADVAKPSQETTSEDPPTEERPKPKGGYQAKIEKQTRIIDTLQAQLDAKDGNETRLKRELEEAKSKLAELEPKETESKPAQLVKPIPPPMPELADFDYDTDKYQVAVKKWREVDMPVHETAMDQYVDAKLEQKLAESRAKDAEERAKKDQEDENARAAREFETRRRKGEALYPDFAELVEALPADAKTVFNDSAVVREYVASESEDPAHLIHYFMKDFLENDGAEGGRIAKLKPMRQAIEIKAIEDRLIAQAGKPAVEVKPPVKEKPRVETPEDPIRPVGSRAGSKGKTLNEQMDEASKRGDSKEFRRLLDLQAKEKQAALV